MPSVGLRSHRGNTIDVAGVSAKAVFFFYPKTGRVGEPDPEGWDRIPGAYGCTAESCSFRDHFTEFKNLGFEVFGVSTQNTADQEEFARRTGIPYELLSDSKLELVRALDLPTFTNEEIGYPLVKRLTIVAVGGEIEKVFYPVFPPDKGADQVLAYLRKETS